VNIPYKLVAAVSKDQRHQQMAEALKTGFPRIQPQPIDDNKVISIACYGPSLAKTWHTITRPIISVSGALHFLAERGVVPDYHVDMDPRSHKVRHIEPPVRGVHYLMASVCPAKTWEILKDEKVTLVHVYSNEGTEDWIRQNDPGQGMIRPGSTSGMAAIHVAGLLGYRRFEIHGMDGSLRDGMRHAGPHYGHPQGGVTWQAGHKVYETSKIMSNACAEVINTFRMYPIIGVFHGEGLQQALIDEEYGLDNVARAGTPKAEMVRRARIQFIAQAA
jgi:hypothetical protein